MKKVIFWDFDGTLVYSNSSFRDSLDEALQAYGYKIDLEIIADFLKSVCSWYCPEKTYVERTGEKWWKDLLASVESFCARHNVALEDRGNVCKLFRQNVVAFQYRLYDDAEEILSYCCRNGYQNYVISNNFPELVDVVKRYHLEQYFEDYILSTNVGYEKPRTEIFQIALEKAGCEKLEESYMVGDNPIADIQGGIAANMKTIFVHGKAGQAVESTYVCENLKDIKKVLHI